LAYRTIDAGLQDYRGLSQGQRQGGSRLTKHHMIVAHEVTNSGNDHEHLSSIAHQARDAIGKGTLTRITRIRVEVE
jgi:hypothetical protein